MTRDAIFLGSIGVVADTSDMQRRAFNAAFAEAGLGWTWEGQEYLDLLQRPGGRRRIADYASARGEDVDATAIHRRKSDLFQEMMRDEGLTLRPGIADIVEIARSGAVRLAGVTTTGRDNLDAYLAALSPALSEDDFDLVTDASMVEAGKPDPAIYSLALERTGLPADAVVAVEDTPECLAAATGAGLAAVAFPNEAAAGRDFPGAEARVDRLAPAALGL